MLYIFTLILVCGYCLSVTAQYARILFSYSSFRNLFMKSIVRELLQEC